MKQNFSTLAAVALLLTTFIGCQKEETKINDPMSDLQDAMKIVTPLALTIPADKHFTLENPCTDEDLLRFEQERILNEKQSLKSVRTLVNGNHTFSYDVTLTKSCTGTTLYDNGYAKGYISAGGLTYKPRFYWAATITGGVLQNTIAYLQNTVTFDPTITVSIYKSVSTTYSKELLSSSQTSFFLAGGLLPSWVTYSGKLNASVYMNASGSCSMSQKVQVVSAATIGAKWIKGVGWSNASSTPNPTITYWAPSYSKTLTFTIQPRFVAEVSAMAYSVVGPKLTVTPYFNFYLNYTSRYIDRYAGIKGDVSFNISMFNITTGYSYSKTVFNVTKPFTRITF